MSIWSRITNLFRDGGLNREIGEELDSHIAEAIEQGRHPAEARRAFGSPLRLREESRDVRLIGWLDSLRADAIFGWRQLTKRKVTSAAAILSLGLAIGACTSAYRLIDALLLRPLPVAEPERLYSADREFIGLDGKPYIYDSWAYPAFVQMRSAVKNQAELIAISYAQRKDLTFGSDQEMEKAHLQYVSGSMFPSFGLQPALGRLLTERDDLKPGKHPYAVLSYDYWTRRFRQDPNVLGRTFRTGSSGIFATPDAREELYEIAGVAREPFTGTEPGTVTGIFVPTMMHPGVTHEDWEWFRTLVRLKPGVAIEPVRARLDAVSRAFEQERAKGLKGMTKESIDRVLAATVRLVPAPAGVSGLQRDYRHSLLALGVLVGLVLLIACANVANLMSAQTAARAREMALRVSIGAGRLRLVQLVLVESVWLGLLAASIGAFFAWWAAPFVVARINPPDNPARLALPADLSVLGFGLVLTFAVTFLFGLAPALRASAVKPAAALKGGEDPHSRRRLMHTLIAAQTAFCFLVLLVAGLFASTFERLSKQPMGFFTERLLTLETVSKSAQQMVFWEQVSEHLRTVPGVEAVGLSGWALLDGSSWNNFLSIDGGPLRPVPGYFLGVSRGWMGTMKIPLIDGRDFRPGDSDPGVAIVNETFVKQFFNGVSPIGKTLAKGGNRPEVYRIVGVVPDAPYKNMRDPILPVAYVPFSSIDSKGAPQPVSNGTFIVRTSSLNPLALASTLRKEVATQPGFRVSNIRTQVELVQAQTVRERLLAMLGLFFAAVALLLAGLGLYGVLDYSVLQRRREIGIRMAIGAQASDVALGVTADGFSMVLVGALAGLTLGLASARYLEVLLYQVKATDLGMLALPSLTILAVALLAALPAVVRAVRIDPVAALRAE